MTSITQSVDLPIRYKREKDLQTTLDAVNIDIKKCNESFNAALRWILMCTLPTTASLVAAHFRHIKVTKLIAITQVFFAVLGISAAAYHYLEKLKRDKELRQWGAYQEFILPPFNYKIEDVQKVQDKEYCVETLSKKLNPEQLDNYKKYCNYDLHQMKDEISTIYEVTISGGKISPFYVQPISMEMKKLEDNLEPVRNKYQSWRKLLVMLISSENAQKIHESAFTAIGAVCHLYRGLFRGVPTDRDKQITYYISDDEARFSLQQGQGKYCHQFWYENGDEFKTFVEKTYLKA